MGMSSRTVKVGVLTATGEDRTPLIGAETEMSDYYGTHDVISGSWSNNEVDASTGNYARTGWGMVTMKGVIAGSNIATG